MAENWLELITGSLEEKKHYKQYRARMKQLPEPYRAAMEAVDRYLMYSGAISKGDVLVTMLGDLADLFEQSEANGIPIRDVVGEDPVEFAEMFLANYSNGQWVDKERQRLITAIDGAVAKDSTKEGTSP